MTPRTCTECGQVAGVHRSGCPEDDGDEPEDTTDYEPEDDRVDDYLTTQ